MPPLALFDRDGTLVVDKHHQFDPGAMEWIDGAFDALRLVRRAGYRLAVITNQSTVARGICTEAQVQHFHDVMAERLQREGIAIDHWAYCPFHGDGVVEPYRIADHPDRKPNPGMITRALRQWNAEPTRSFMIGDAVTDVQAGENAGILGVRYVGNEPLDRAVARVVQGLAFRPD